MCGGVEPPTGEVVTEQLSGIDVKSTLFFFGKVVGKKIPTGLLRGAKLLEQRQDAPFKRRKKVLQRACRKSRFVLRQQRVVRVVAVTDSPRQASD